MTKPLAATASALSAALLLFACTPAAPEAAAGDPTFFLTGTEELAQAAALADGGTAPSCDAPKVLICHVPPGNPANAHSICVSQSAVDAHSSHHGDLTGACAPSAPADAGVLDAGAIL